MRAIIATCAALSLVAGLAGHADASTSRKYKKHSSVRHTDAARYGYQATNERYRTNSTPNWSPHDSNVLPFGSKLWWEQKSRESGGNRE